MRGPIALCLMIRVRAVGRGFYSLRSVSALARSAPLR
jgi:hypothetical protein